jgi:DNA-binding transcriptional LysR family regulator
MELDQLAAFVAIAQQGTFTRAAARLHRTQPAISRRLALLEAELGAPLVERRSAGVSLSDVGRVFLPYAEAVLAAAASGAEAVRAELAAGAGGASLAIVGTLVERPLARALRRFLRPPTHLSVFTATSAEVSRLVRRGEAAIGVRYFEDDDRALVSETIGAERMCVVAPARHAFAASTPRKADQMRRQRWIGFPRTRTSKEDFGRLLQRQLTAAGLDQSEVMAVDSLSAQKRLVEAGLGIALLPESSVREEVQKGTLAIVRAPRIATTVPIAMHFRRDGYLSPASRELLALLRRVFSKGG